MKRQLTLVLLLLGIALSVASTAVAQNGPYYATPSWDQTIACTTAATCTRFVVLANFGGAAVLDRETGLVWERSPSSMADTWTQQTLACNLTMVGGRFGFRLPTVSELLSLLDNGALPPGHPFTNIQVSTTPVGVGPVYWTSTSDAGAASNALAAGFDSTFEFFTFAIPPKTNGFTGFRWCVRGGVGVNSSQN